MKILPLRITAAAVALLSVACSSKSPSSDAGTDGGNARDSGPSPADRGVPRVSRTLALSADGGSLWVVNTDSDSVSEIDLGSQTLKREIPLTAHPPALDPVTHRYDPAVRPRALALVDVLGKLYVAGEAANAVLVVDIGSGQVKSSIPVGAEPTAVLASNDGSRIYVVNHQSATVQAIDTSTDTVVQTLAVSEHPWGASLRADGSLLYVSHLLLNPGVSIIDTGTFTLAGFTALPDQPPDPSGNKVIPNGQVRGAYTAVAQPNTGEIWVPHMLLATGTPQPQLDFDSTAFPTYTLLSPGGGQVDRRLLFRPSSVLTYPGAFTDSVSGPRDVAFTPDGKLALVALAQSEDVMVFDANADVEVGLVRPTPGTLLEGILVDPSGSVAYLQGRNSHNVTILSIAQSPNGPMVAVEGNPYDGGIECLAGSDPMEGVDGGLRLGQRLFYTANSRVFPITQDFWMACSTCHLEGQSDAVTWKFLQGPRDTPSNAGGPINTGFLFRQATRNTVLDYDLTIQIEQGGSFHRTDQLQLPDLQALTDFTNYAIPFPQNPNLEPDGGLTPQQQYGATLFLQARCQTCHSGPFYTDSGAGNPTLNLAGLVVLHDAGTCVTSGSFPDEPSTDVDGGYRSACAFDTPTLRGIFATPPYFHDGSATTLEEAVLRMGPAAGFTFDGGNGDVAALAAYLRTL